MKIDYINYKTEKFVNNPFYSNLMFPDTNWVADTTAAMWMRARQISIGFQGNAEGYVWFDNTRLNQLKQFLEDHEDNYLLFYNYTPELYEIERVCRELGYNVDIYSGEIKSLEFYNTYANQTPAEQLINKKNIILANFVSGSTGMNWQEYNKCIIFSKPPFRDWEQGLKRIHRAGQKSTCIYHLFYQENWLEKGMQETLDNGGEYNDEMFMADLKRNNEILEKEEKESTEE